MKLSRLEILLLVVLAVGVVFTLVDYRKWRNIEFGRYGQGPITNQPIASALFLDGRYQNVLVRLRISYPQAWKTFENPATADPKKPPKIDKRVEVVRFDAGNEVLAYVTVEKVSRNLVDEVDTIAKKLTLSREREYISADKANFTILTWISGTITHQAAYTIRNNIMFTVYSQSPTAVWANYEKTFWAMYSSFVPL